jgi:hypothetical protein
MVLIPLKSSAAVIVTVTGLFVGVVTDWLTVIVGADLSIELITTSFSIMLPA